MGYALRPTLSYCWIGDEPFFLDAQADRYFRLGGGAARAFAAFSSGQTLSEEDVSALTTSGVLHSLDGPAQRPIPALAPECFRTFAVGDAPPSVGILLLAMFDYAATALALRFGSFLEVTRKLAGLAGRREKPIDQKRLAAVIGAYRLLDLIISPNGRCLPRSLAMARTSMRYGGGFSIVLGVRNGPFGAHCWLQKDETVLNDRLDNIHDFVPILVL